MSVVKFFPKGAAKDPDAVLEQAIGQYDDVVIIGWDKEGLLDPRASLGLNSANILWLLTAMPTPKAANSSRESVLAATIAAMNEAPAPMRVPTSRAKPACARGRPSCALIMSVRRPISTVDDVASADFASGQYPE